MLIQWHRLHTFRSSAKVVSACVKHEETKKKTEGNMEAIQKVSVSKRAARRIRERRERREAEESSSTSRRRYSIGEEDAEEFGLAIHLNERVTRSSRTV